MSQWRRSIHNKRNSFQDRAKVSRDSFAQFLPTLDKLDSALLLLSSEEHTVLIAVFKHLAEFSRRSSENVIVLKENNLLQLLLDHEFYRENPNLLIQRFALYMSSILMENTNTLLELTAAKTKEILNLSVLCYLDTDDEFCKEYLSVIINKCLDDPQLALKLLEEAEFMEKYYEIIMKTDDPDTLYHSFDALQKLLSVQNPIDIETFSTNLLFPVDRVLCELNDDIKELRLVALKVVKILIANTGEMSLFGSDPRAIYTMDQLIKLFCRADAIDTLPMTIEVLATALHSERMSQLFMSSNLFNIMDQHIAIEWTAPPFDDLKCSVMTIINELAQWHRFHSRLHQLNYTSTLLRCVLSKTNVPATFIISALNRLMKYPQAAIEVVAALDEGLAEQIFGFMPNLDIPIKSREQSVQLVVNLLVNGFHQTAGKLFDLGLPTTIAEIFDQGLEQLSTDYVLTLINIIEYLAQNENYRSKLSQCEKLSKSIALLLKTSFSSAAVVSNILRCLCLLIDEEILRKQLLSNYFIPSLKRALQSLSNMVKTGATNFIMQSTRFANFIHEYIYSGVLEVLIFHQKHAYCVLTWGPAIDAILAKSTTLKFCIRNHLDFTDSTADSDFYISKKKFEDFRTFLNILTSDCSPLHPILIMNFNRPETSKDGYVTVPCECFAYDNVQCPLDDWVYSRKPGDAVLPVLLETLNTELEKTNYPVKMSRCIDFEGIAKRAKVIAQLVAEIMDTDLKTLDLNTPEECAQHTVRCHLKELSKQLHCSIIPLGMVHTGCLFERAVLFKGFADQIGMPCTLQRSVDGRVLFNELPLPLEREYDVHCDNDTMRFMSWRMLRPTHIVDLLYNVGSLYPLQSRQALQYLRLY